MSREPTKQELLAALNDLQRKVVTLESRLETALDKIEQQDRIIEYKDRIISFYQNPNTPPSADSLEWKRQKRQKAEQRKAQQKIWIQKTRQKKGPHGSITSPQTHQNNTPHL